MQVPARSNRIALMASSVPSGHRILELLRSPDGRRALIEAADHGRPPVSGMSTTLLNTFGAEVMRDRVVKQFVGLVVRSVLSDEGFVLERKGVRLRADPVFEAGSVYRRKLGSAPIEGRPLLQRFVDGLNAEERRWVHRYIQDLTDQDPESAS